MRRGLTFLELVVALTAAFVLVTALAVSVREASRRARIERARMDMFGIAAEIESSSDSEAAAARIRERGPCDPWGRPYRVEVRPLEIDAGEGVAAGNTAVWIPNAYRAERRAP